MMSDGPSGLGIWGRPLIENPAMTAQGSATTSIAFGAFSDYTVVRLPVRVESSRDAYVGSTSMFATDQVALRVISRLDGKLVLPDSLRYLVRADSWQT